MSGTVLPSYILQPITGQWMLLALYFQKSTAL